jgi:dTMP kinase
MDGILADIEKGVTVIIDRYSYSGAVYSAAKDNPNLDLDWAWAPEIGLPQPDLCFFLSIKPHEAAKRGGFGEERYETQQMQLRVRRLFTELFDRIQPSDLRICLIDAGKSREEVAANIFQQVSSLLNGLREQNWPKTLSRLGPLGSLTKDRPNPVAFS